MIKRFVLIMVILVLTAGCQSIAKRGKSDIQPLAMHDAMNAGLFEAPKIIMHEGNPAYTFYDDNSRLMMHYGKELKWVSEGSPEPSLLSYNNPLVDGKYIYNVWRPKAAKGSEDVGAKFVNFNASYDGGMTFTKPVSLNKRKKAIQPRIAASGKGDVYVIWTDERDSKFDLYMNISHDYGRTWLESDIRVNTNTAPGTVQSLNPVILTTGKSVRVFWIDRQGGYTDLMMRLSSDSGRTWDEPISITRQKGSIYDPKILNIDGRILALWCGISKAHKRRARWTLYGLYTDNGKEWLPIPDLSSFSSAIMFEISEAFDSSGNIYIAMAHKETITKGIYDIFFISSPDRGETWTDLKMLNTNTPKHTYSILPKIAADDNGNVAVVWIDYRNIRGNVYMNMSDDFGKSWLEKDIRVSDMAFNANLPDLITDRNGNFYTVWLQYKNDKIRDDAYTVLSRFSGNSIKSDPVFIPDRKRLEKRVKTFWNARIKGDFGSNYDQMDPIFRAKNEKIKYMGKMVSDIVFHDFNIENIEITEKIAKVKIRYSFEIPDSVILGQRINLPKRDDILVQDWIWIDRDWYKIQKRGGTKRAYMPYYPAFPK